MHEVIVYRGERQEQAGRACIRAEMVHDHLTGWTRLHAATRSTTFHCPLEPIRAFIKLYGNGVKWMLGQRRR